MCILPPLVLIRDVAVLTRSGSGGRIFPFPGRVNASRRHLTPRLTVVAWTVLSAVVLRGSSVPPRTAPHQPVALVHVTSVLVFAPNLTNAKDSKNSKC